MKKFCPVVALFLTFALLFSSCEKTNPGDDINEPDTKTSGIYRIDLEMDESDFKELLSNPTADIEKPTHVEIINKAGETIIDQDAGIKIFGGSSRGLQQKSFKIIARKDGYFEDAEEKEGTGYFNYPLFEDRIIKAGKNKGNVLEKYDSFILRNGGNDSLLHTACNPLDATLLRDGISNNLINALSENVDNQLSQFAELYINGKYYGLMDMKENLNEDYVRRIYGVDRDYVCVVKSELDTTRHCDNHSNGAECRFCNVWFYYETDEDEMCQNALSEWCELCEEIIQGIDSNDDTYNKLYEKLSSNVDLKSFLEYCVFYLYLANTDWPHNNLKLWKYCGEEDSNNYVTDGKWRFMTRDLDMSMGRYSSPELCPELNNVIDQDTFYRCLGNYVDGYSSYFSNEGINQLYPDSLYLQGLLAFCLRNDSFRSQFEEFTRNLASDETKKILIDIYNEAYDEAKPYIGKEIERWSDYIAATTEDWQDACIRIKGFINVRPSYFLKHLDLLLSFYK